MIHLTDVRSLADFRRHAANAIEELKRTGQPQVLTVDGKAAVVVQGVVSYQRLLEIVDRAEALIGIQRGLESAAANEGLLVDEAFDELFARHAISDET